MVTQKNRAVLVSFGLFFLVNSSLLNTQDRTKQLDLVGITTRATAWANTLVKNSSQREMQIAVNAAYIAFMSSNLHIALQATVNNLIYIVSGLREATLSGNDPHELVAIMSQQIDSYKTLSWQRAFSDKQFEACMKYIEGLDEVTVKPLIEQMRKHGESTLRSWMKHPNNSCSPLAQAMHQKLTQSTEDLELLKDYLQALVDGTITTKITSFEGDPVELASNVFQKCCQLLSQNSLELSLLGETALTEFCSTVVYASETLFLTYYTTATKAYERRYGVENRVRLMFDHEGLLPEEQWIQELPSPDEFWAMRKKIEEESNKESAE